MTPAELRREAEGWAWAARGTEKIIASPTNLEHFANNVIDLTRTAEADEALARLWSKKHAISAKLLDEIAEFADNAFVSGMTYGVLQWKDALKVIAQLARR